ncbi:MAG: glycerate kinase [Bacteroidales bacterium]
MPPFANILIAPDSFKDCLPAGAVADALRAGILDILPGTEVHTVPMADGGEGTVDAVVDATRGERVAVEVMDPLLRPVPSFYGITGEGTTAVIEMAAASGIELLAPGERNPWVTSTFGTGQLILDALNRDCRRIIVGIGGSATNDGGAGMAVALGVRLISKEGNDCREGGGGLGALQRISVDSLDPRIRGCEVLVACDVTNPLTGPHGASATYGPQKGADPAMVERLDRNLIHYASVIREQLGQEVDGVPGAGAAGGLGAGLMAFAGARLVNGFSLIAEVVGLENRIREADLVITGEGRMDEQTLFGKTPFGVAQLAKKYGKPVIGVAGSLEPGAGILYGHGFDLLMPIQEKPADLTEAINHAEDQLRRTGERIARILTLGSV